LTVIFSLVALEREMVEIRKDVMLKAEFEGSVVVS
jgi:hypothetical protein